MGTASYTKESGNVDMGLEEHYKTLGVPEGAGKEEITASYRRLCKLYHTDVNPDPAAAEKMKLINLAYGVLKGGAGKKRYSVQDGFKSVPAYDWEKAEKSVRGYFEALLKKEHERAFQMISLFDRRYVAFGSFKKWRDSVDRIFSVRSYGVVRGGPPSVMELEGAGTVEARRFYIGITEKNLVTNSVERYSVTKCAVRENGRWGVFLGYRDLNEIARSFEWISAEHERGEMSRHWEEYCRNHCRELDMLSLQGFLHEARRELYRHERYGRQLAVCVLKIGRTRDPAEPELLETAAEAVSASLRETDIPAYLGNGVFAVLLTELRKKHADTVAERLAEKVSKVLSAAFGKEMFVKSAYSPYGGGELEPYVRRLENGLNGK